MPVKKGRKMETENYPPLEQFENLILFAASHCVHDAYEIEDIAQEMCMKYEKCKKKVPPCEFTAYYKTAIWNYVRSYLHKIEIRDKYECPLFDVLGDEENLAEEEKEIENKDWIGNVPKEWKAMYEDGSFLKILSQGREGMAHGSRLSRPMSLYLIAENLGKNWREVMEILGVDSRFMKKRLESIEAARFREKYRKVNAEAYRGYRKNYRDNHPDNVKESNKKYYQDHLDWFQEYYQENKTKIREYQNKYYQRSKAWFQEYYQKNEERLRECRNNRYEPVPIRMAEQIGKKNSPLKLKQFSQKSKIQRSKA
jgi:hypothetical protein